MTYAMRVTANLYVKLFEAAFRSVDEGAPGNYGVNRAELAVGSQNGLRRGLAA